MRQRRYARRYGRRDGRAGRVERQPCCRAVCLAFCGGMPQGSGGPAVAPLTAAPQDTLVEEVPPGAGEPMRAVPATILPGQDMNLLCAGQERPAECASIGLPRYGLGLNATDPDIGKATPNTVELRGSLKGTTYWGTLPVAHTLRNHGPEDLVYATKTNASRIGQGDKPRQPRPPRGPDRVG